MRLTLRQLEVFAAIGQGGNVSRAAERLSMSQSAASTALGELERQFGRPLFDRAGKKLKLNELGEMLLPKALEVLDRANDIEAMLTGSGFGALRLGATLTIGNYLAPMIIETYRRRHPGAEVKLEIANTSRIAARVADFDLDLALVEGEYADPRLAISDWQADELAIFCAPSHPLARQGQQGPVSVDLLLEEEWVVREHGSGTRQTLDRALTPYWPRWKIAVELEHTEAIKRMVEAGNVIGCVSRLALQDAFATGRLVEIPARDLDLRRRFYFVINREKFKTPGIDAFLNICREMDSEERSG